MHYKTDMDNPLNRAKAFLQQFKNKPLSHVERIEASLQLAKELLLIGQEEKTASEAGREHLLAGLMQSKEGKAFCSQVADSCFRTKNPKRLVRHLISLIDRFGIPPFFSFPQKALLHLVRLAGPYMPKLTAIALQAIVEKEMLQVIMPGEEAALTQALVPLKKACIKVNLNRLGEAILGEAEAKKRIEDLLKDLENSAVDTISIKISSIYSHINLLAWDDTLQELKKRFRIILRKSQLYNKMVNLDMEEYKDLELTVQLFQEVLSEPEFIQTRAGVALQSYIPESFTVQEKLTEWAIKRKGAPIKIRIVKGANLGMERVEASIKGWPQAPYTNKLDVDANYKKMVHFGLKKEHARCVEIGIGSHNLFDMAYAMIVAEEEAVSDFVVFEMLSGMAPHLARAVLKLTDRLLLYCPAAKKEEFHTAMAYLMRRLDENTAPDNFLTNLFDLKPESTAWKKQVEQFALAALESDTVSNRARRTQNRSTERYEETRNTPDTDWSRPENRIWAKEMNVPYLDIPLVIDGKEVVSKNRAHGIDPSNPDKKIHSYSLASIDDVDLAIKAAHHEASCENILSKKERIFLLKKIAESLFSSRKTLIAAMVQEVGKAIPEADSEVSEAIDFASYYAKILEDEPYEFQTNKVSVAITPWNFPCSIPASAILAPLATGNSVLFKPAPEAVLCGWLLANAFWNAGVSKTLLQFISCIDDPVGSYLVKNPRVNQVILTGATTTARHFLQMRPNLSLFGETGGKNSIIVTALSDRDQAVKDIVQSSFAYAGQKCSACSLLILEKEVYYDQNFRQQLYDATSSLIVGSAHNLSSQVTPLIRPASPHLQKALTTLEQNEWWLLQPKQDKINPHLWSPGIKFDVERKSFMHMTEFFGPLLAVICAENLEEAIEIANETDYGLTAGLQSLDPEEETLWLKKIKAGNCYIRRPITGAIVGRQPFGGTKASSFGIGMKVGGPNYLFQFLDNEGNRSDSDYFSKTHELQRVLGQDNLLTFQPRTPLFVLFHNEDDIEECKQILTDGAMIGCHIVCGAEDEIKKKLDIANSYDEVIQQIMQHSSAHVRTVSAPSNATLEKISLHISALDIHKPSSSARLELLHYVREVSISKEYHRYGNLMEREGEFREPVL
jgi:RHH-type proline utilization regulon transcriptional repressor/proline dehydrogenase/delta 1-pyrroline-5-carboxylate dehydrogenase